MAHAHSVMQIGGDAREVTYDELERFAERAWESCLVICDPRFLTSLIGRCLENEDMVEMYLQVDQIISDGPRDR